jgi:HPt (histidine-containing phosphotransfer) domain-containing protein
MTTEPALPMAHALDASALARLRELDPGGQHGVVARVMATFDSSLRRMMGQLEAERGTGNVVVVSGIAHTLKSSSASVGALALAALCTEIEGRLRTGDVSTLQADIDRMLAEGEAALAAVAPMLSP